MDTKHTLKISDNSFTVLECEDLIEPFRDDQLKQVGGLLLARGRWLSIYS